MLGFTYEIFTLLAVYPYKGERRQPHDTHARRIAYDACPRIPIHSEF